MITPVMLHEDAAFYEYFKPYHHPGACHESSACCLLNKTKEVSSTSHFYMRNEY